MIGRIDGFPVIVLDASAVPVTVTGTTSEVEFARFMIPPGMLSAGVSFRLHVLSTQTNNANAKTLRGRLGGVQFSSTAFLASSQSATWGFWLRARSLTQQLCFPSVATWWNVGASTLGLTNVDMSIEQALTLTIQLANGADTFTMEAYTLEVVG